MSQSKVITNDAEERADFKSRLNDKLGGFLTPPAAVIAEPRVLLLPQGHEDMVEAELLFTLTHNPELAHSRDSAIMAVNLLHGRAAKPTNITFKVVELTNPVPVPEFVAEIPARRKSSGVAPGFARLKDSAPEREDKEDLKKVQFKQSLQDAIDRKLAETPQIEKIETRVLLIPEGHAQMNEAVLRYTLAHNTELKHTTESAALTVNLLHGRAAKPTNITFKVVELTNPVPVPEFVAEIPARRKSSGVAPGFARLKDSAPEREDKEDLKKVQFKQSLQDAIDRKLAETPQIEKVETRVLLVPSNYEELTAADLHFTLVNDPALKHSHDSALLTIDVVNGRVRPTNTILQTVGTALPVAAQPKRAVKAPLIKARAQDVTSIPHGSGGEVMLLPANYQELSEAELGFVLTHTPELQHTPEEASFVLDVLFGRTEAQGVKFEVYQNRHMEIYGEPNATKDARDLASAGPRVLLLPANYRDFSATELHAILVSTPELNHSDESATLAVSTITNMKVPNGLELRLSEVEAKREGPIVKTPKRVLSKTWIKTDLASLPSVADRVITLPQDFKAMTEQQFVFVLANECQVHLALALDIVDVLKGIRDLPEGIGLTVKE